MVFITNTQFQLRFVIPIFIVFMIINCLQTAPSSQKRDDDVEEISLNQLQNNQTTSICTTPGCIAAASTVLKYMDPAIDPCDDFYKFACGGFQNRTLVPEDSPIVISFHTTTERVEEQVKLILEEPISPNEPKAFALLKKYYNVCLNVTAINEDGLKPAQLILKELGGWPVLEGDDWKEEQFDWKETLYKFRKLGLSTNSLQAVHIDIDSKNTTRRIIHLEPVILGLNQQYLVEGFENERVKNYWEHLIDIALIFGANQERASLELKEAVAFEMELAKLVPPPEERRNLSVFYNPMSIADLQIKFPSIPWLSFINNIIQLPELEILDSEVVIARVPKFISELELLLNSTNKRTLANYLLYREVLDIITYLVASITSLETKYSSLSEGMTGITARWRQCSDKVVSELNIGTAASYVRRYFNKEAKRKAQNIVSDVQNAVKNYLKTVEWMDATTKKSALEKADAMLLFVGYPDELLDDNKIEEYYKKLEPADNYLDFALKIKKFTTDKSLLRLRDVVNKSDWVDHSDATYVSAQYIEENSIELLAGILQGDFFDNNRPQYMNYGAIGYVTGHEITHAFDDLGRQFNKDGELFNWWAESTEEAFLEKSQCMIDQYSAFTVPEVGLKLNGFNTQAEDIADNGGVKAAYLAYTYWVKRNGEERMLPGLNFTSNQMFWISSASVWCNKQRNEYLRNYILTNAHSPAYYRVIVPLSNSEEFSKDFNCPVGSKMNPVHKCKVW